MDDPKINTSHEIIIWQEKGEYRLRYYDLGLECIVKAFNSMELLIDWLNFNYPKG